ncbi:hypothetical protein BV898_01005 [Hypsibius exemplaris]|uniref:Uncharacterized protein n=1 Tax=Hypsibius exemplaris TaxID=2072580 RepID=A0A1W0XCW2_HYPEX|nr:hypothetical protein BV898_01005 [Hypsibius exemplaris]
MYYLTNRISRGNARTRGQEAGAPRYSTDPWTHLLRTHHGTPRTRRRIHLVHTTVLYGPVDALASYPPRYSPIRLVRTTVLHGPVDPFTSYPPRYSPIHLVHTTVLHGPVDALASYPPRYSPIYLVHITVLYGPVDAFTSYTVMCT